MRARVIIVAFLATLPSCYDDLDTNSFRDDPAITTLNGTWRVISFEDYNTEKVEFKTHENSWDCDIVVTFDDTADPHSFSGRNLTNSIFGEFDYLGNRQFKLRRLGTTFVNEPKWGEKFREAVCGKEVMFSISGERLKIYFAGNIRSVTLVKE